jgi:hypothetical protein
MPHSTKAIRTALVAAVVFVGSASAAGAQGARASSTPQVKHAPICAQGVKVYTDRSQIPVPFDTLEVPAPDGPVRVTNEQEAEAAELALRGRAGSVGATGVLLTDEVQEDNDGNRRVRRAVKGLFVPADSARAHGACK